MANRVRSIRYIEIFTGIFLILAVIGALFAMLSDFSIVTPNSTLQEDMSGLSDNIEGLRISTLVRLGCGVLLLLLLPFLMLTFSYHTKVYHYITGFLILLISAYYFLSAWAGFRMISFIRTLPTDFMAGTESEQETALLFSVRQIQNLIMVGRMTIGLFLILFAFSKIKAHRIPLFSTVLLLLSGPLIIFFSWYNPEQLILTIAMACAAIGVVVLGLRLINRGLLWLPLKKNDHKDH